MEKDNKLRGSLLDIVTKSYLTYPTECNRFQPPVHVHKTKTKPTECGIYNMAKSSIHLSRQLVGHYNRICQQIAAAEGDLRTQWGVEGDIPALQNILHSQEEKAKVKVDHILNDSSRPAKGPCDINASAAGDDFWSKFAVPPKDDRKAVKDTGETWAMAAKSIHKGVQRIVKCLPEDTER